MLKKEDQQTWLEMLIILSSKHKKEEEALRLFQLGITSGEDEKTAVEDAVYELDLFDPEFMEE